MRYLLVVVASLMVNVVSSGLLAWRWLEARWICWGLGEERAGHPTRQQHFVVLVLSFSALPFLYLKQSFGSCYHPFFSLLVRPFFSTCMLSIRRSYLGQSNVPADVLFLKLSLTVVNCRLLWVREVPGRIYRMNLLCFVFRKNSSNFSYRGHLQCCHPGDTMLSFKTLGVRHVGLVVLSWWVGEDGVMLSATIHNESLWILLSLFTLRH